VQGFGVHHLLLIGQGPDLPELASEKANPRERERQIPKKPEGLPLFFSIHIFDGHGATFFTDPGQGAATSRSEAALDILDEVGV
jgi:hypothetical protein